MEISLAIWLWLLFFTANLASNTVTFMVRYFTMIRGIMSRRFEKKSDLRAEIVNRIKEVIADNYGTHYGAGADFRRAMNITPGTFNNIMKGAITPEFLIEFSTQHHVNLNWLLRNIRPKSMPESPKEQPEISKE